MRIRTGALVVALFLALPLSAGWWEVWERDMSFDLEGARELALATIADDPSSAEAIAAASWWLANVEHLAAPEEVLAVAVDGRDPELGLVLGRIENRLTLSAPPGALTEAEISGAFGVFSTLEEVVAFYNDGGGSSTNKDPLLQPLDLTADEQASLVSFLNSLCGDKIIMDAPEMPEYAPWDMDGAVVSSR